MTVLLEPEGKDSPPSHWKLTVAPSVVLDTALMLPLEVNSGLPQSAEKGILIVKIWQRRMINMTKAGRNRKCKGESRPV